MPKTSSHPINTRPAFLTKSCSVPAEIKADVDKRTIVGYASTWDRDLVGDMIERGAFTRTIEQRFAKGLIKTFLNHSEPIGVPTRMEQDEKGLHTESRIIRTRKGDEALEMAREGVTAHMSIGFDIIKGYETEDDESGEQTRHLTEIKLWEFGPVIWPANEEADILAVKAYRDELTNLAQRLPDLAAALVKRLKRDDWSITELGEVDAIGYVLKQVGIDILTATRDSADTAPATPDVIIDPEVLRDFHSQITALKARALRL